MFADDRPRGWQYSPRTSYTSPSRSYNKLLGCAEVEVFVDVLVGAQNQINIRDQKHLVDDLAPIFQVIV